MGTVLERSHIPLCTNGFWLPTSWQRARRASPLTSFIGRSALPTSRLGSWPTVSVRPCALRGWPAGGEGKIVEADETYLGKHEKSHVAPQRNGRPYIGAGVAEIKRAIVALVERGGHVRSFHVGVADKETVRKIVTENVARETPAYRRKPPLYWSRCTFASHETVKHTPRNTFAATCIPIQPKAISRFSSAV